MPAALFAVLLVTAGGKLDIVAVVPSSNDQVSLVAHVDPERGQPPRSEHFSVTAGTERLPVRAAPVISDRPNIGLVVDASATEIDNLHAGLSGVANFLLQMPLRTKPVLVADAKPPTVLTPLGAGTSDALRALSDVQARGERATSDALRLVLRQLPEASDGPRVVVLYTRGNDAGGESAADLADRLVSAHALLAVVSAGADTRYWSRVATATGGVLVTARPPAVMSAFDDVAAELRARYMLTFPAPGRLPAQVSVRLNTADGALTADTVVQPAAVRRNGTASPSNDSGGGVNVFWVSVLVAGTLLALGAAALLIAGQTRGEGTPGPDVTDPVADERLDAVLHAGEPIRGQTTEMERGTPPAEGPRPAEPVPASRDEPAAPSADEPSRPGVHIFDMSDPGTPREIAFYNEEEAYDLTRPLAAGPRTGDEQPADQDADATPALETPASVETPGVVGVVDTEAKAASASAAGSESGAATAAAAIVAAEQRAIAAAEQRAIAAAEQQARAVAKAAAKAATWSARRRASRPATRPGVTSEKRDRGD